MSLKRSLFKKLLQSVLTVSDRDGRRDLRFVVGMISFVREKFVSVVEYVCEGVVEVLKN